ncbi:MAG TPA: hypothetical protein VE074_06405, partial [Jatrophihabitantaceae bacterium]|nr:hypothetical protein [Jatrophihabitantaceae bacterium]
TITIGRAGQLTINYGGMAPASYTVRFLIDRSATVHATVTVTGTDTATLDLKQAGVWHPASPKIGMKATGHLDNGPDAAGVGNFIGPILNGSWAIAGKTLTVHGTGELSRQGTWTFAKVK